MLARIFSPRTIKTHIRTGSLSSASFRKYGVASAASSADMKEPVASASSSTQLTQTNAVATGSPRVDNDKILRLVDDISHLTLAEASSLVDALKLRLNIKDIVSAQPMMAAPTSSNAAPAVQEEEEPKKVQTEFTITLESFDAAAKAKVIREVKNILNCNLVEAKKFVESAPKKLIENIGKDQVEKIQQALEACGAKLKIE